MEKYILLNWPASQPFQSNSKCIPSPEGERGDMFVPEEIYLKSKAGRPSAMDILDAFQDVKQRLLSFIAKNVPEKGITLKKEEIDTDECRVLVTEHFTGEPTLVNVTKIYPYRVEGKDSYGNDLDRISLQTDCSLDAVYDIARFLVYYRKKTRV